MNSAPQNLLQDYVNNQHFTSTAEVMQAMKEMFRDVIQQVMEVEMDEELGRQRCQRSGLPEGTPRNYRNGYGKKTIKTQLGEVDIKVLHPPSTVPNLPALTDPQLPGIVSPAQEKEWPQGHCIAADPIPEAVVIRTMVIISEFSLEYNEDTHIFL